MGQSGWRVRVRVRVGARVRVRVRVTVRVRVRVTHQSCAQEGSGAHGAEQG